MKTQAEGSLTIFSALSLLLILSFLLALLEGARVSGLKTMDTLAAETGMDSVASEYQAALWDKYHLLYLDGAYGSEDFNRDKVTSHVMEHITANLPEEGEMNMFRTRLGNASLVEYTLATDNDGTGILHQAAAYMKEHLPEDIAGKMYQQYQEGKKTEKNGKTEYSVEDADTAIQNAKKEREEAENAGQSEGADGQETGEAVTEPETSDQGGDNKEETDEVSPLQLVLSLKQNAILGMTVSDTDALSDRAITLQETVSERQCETGISDNKNKDKLNWFDRVMVLEYIEEHFSDYAEPGKGDLAYETEYILFGKDTDKKNLEATVERILLMREAANVTHIIADKEKLNQALVTATALAGFSGNPAVVKIVQIGVVAAWAYVESILDLRTLLSGGKIALIKNGTEWTADLKNLGEIVGNEWKAKECKEGFSYQTYMKQMLFAMQERKMAYRMMDIMELTIEKEQNSQNARMDHMIDTMVCELQFESEPLFARGKLYGGTVSGTYMFLKRQTMSYSNE